MKTIFLTVAAFWVSGCGPVAFAYSDEQLAMAIYYAEGGEAAQYPFGIRSVHCEGFTDCKAICLKTLKNYHQRYKKHGRYCYSTYLRYLASRYCPVGGRGLTAKDRKLNRFWLKNVQFYLEVMYGE